MVRSRFREYEVKKLRSPACSRQKNTTFSPHFLRAWVLWICQSLYIVHSANSKSEKRGQTQIKGSAFGFLEDGLKLNYNPHLTNHKKIENLELKLWVFVMIWYVGWWNNNLKSTVFECSRSTIIYILQKRWSVQSFMNVSASQFTLLDCLID